MKRMTHAQVGAFVITITASGLALANCPDSMPVQILKDCIVYEGAGSDFPTSDYANMDQYQDWLKTTQPQAIAMPATATTPMMK
jgi:hypothetical protein